MQINLKKDEIEQALKNHLSNQGIVIQNKTVEFTFSLKRKGVGISVRVSIQDSGVPSFAEAIVDEDAPAPPPALKVVEFSTPVETEAVTHQDFSEGHASVEEPSIKTSSLFS